MKNQYTTRLLTSLATIGCCALLLADSAEPYCGASKSKFDQTFDYTTTCNGNHSGRIRISTAGTIALPVAGGQTDPNETIVSVLSGEKPDADVAIGGSCGEEDAPTLLKSVTFSFPSSSGTLNGSTSGSSTGGGGAGGMGGAPPSMDKISARCSIVLSSDLGKHIECQKSTSEELAGCTLQLTALP